MIKQKEGFKEGRQRRRVGRMQGAWAVREDWTAVNLASGLEKLKNVGETLQEHSKKVNRPGACASSLLAESTCVLLVLDKSMCSCPHFVSRHGRLWAFHRSWRLLFPSVCLVHVSGARAEEGSAHLESLTWPAPPLAPCHGAGSV